MFDFSRHVFDPPNLKEGVEALKLVHVLSDTYPETTVTTSLGVATEVKRIVYAPLTNVSVIAWKVQSKLIIGFSGLKMANDGLAFVRGAARQGYYEGIAGWVNELSARWADFVRPFLLPHVTTEIGEIWCYGHSMGGTIAPLIAWSIKNRWPERAVYCTTYGAPKFASRHTIPHLDRATCMRVTVESDFVPYLMPTPVQAPIFCAMSYNPIGVGTWSQHVHCRNHICLGPAGQLYFERDPRGITMPIELDTAGFINHMVHQRERHGLQEHGRRLMLAYPNFTTETPANNIVIRDTEIQAMHFPQMAEIRQQVAAAQEQLNDRFDLPQWTASVPSRIKVKRVGRTHYVFFDKDLFYAGTSRSDAKAVARALRGMLRQYLQNPGRYHNQADLFAIFRGEVFAEGNLNPPPGDLP